MTKHQSILESMLILIENKGSLKQAECNMAEMIEKELEKIDPCWKLHEEKMKNVLLKHPDLMWDVRELYNVSVQNNTNGVNNANL